MSVLAREAGARPAKPAGDPGPTRAQNVVEFAVLAVGLAFVLWRLRPALILSDTLPAGGDLSSHVWGPRFLARDLLPGLSGWSWDWFAGFPAYDFYPVLPALIVAAFDVVLPYGVALKITVALGPLGVLAASWAFARGWRLPFPAGPLLVTATLVFLFDPANAEGGTIAGTVAGEFSLTLALALGIAAIGGLGRVITDGRLRTTTALAVAAAALAHPLGLLFTLVCAAVLTAVQLDRGRRVLARRVFPVLAVGLALAGTWWIPFALRRGMMTSPDFPRGTGIGRLLPFGWGEPLLLGLAAAGCWLAVRAGHRVAGALAVAALTFAVLYLALPTGQLHNTRVLPFWSWCRLALAALAGAQLAALLAARRFPRLDHPARLLPAAPLAALVGVLATTAVAWHLPPFGHGGERDEAIEIAMAGYQRNPQYGEYAALMETMARLGRDNGCGRFAWSVDVDTTDFGTVSNDLAPYWTDGCITSLSGLYYDSSATTPFISLTESLVGIAALRFGPDVPGRAFDLETGIRHLRYAGVRYYAARTDSVVRAADAQAGLREVATTGGWHVYEVAGSEIVTGLAHEPIVLAARGTRWTPASMAYVAGTREWDELLLAERGPRSWGRLTSAVFPPERAVTAAKVDDIRLTGGGLRFQVDRTGVPVLVKASWFPTWRAHGADGPYRVAGNMMVVVPTQTDVRLDHADRAPEWLARASLALGGAGVLWLFLLDRGRRRAGPLEGPARVVPSGGRRLRLERAVESRRAIWVVAGLAGVFQFGSAWREHGILWPDEIHQTAEAAHRVAFGYGFTAWEFDDGLRSYLYPAALAGLWKLCALVGIDEGLSLMRAARLLSAALAVAAVTLGVVCARRLAGPAAGLLAGAFGVAFPLCVVYGPRTFTESVTAPLVLAAVGLVLAYPDSPRLTLLAGTAAGLAAAVRPQNLVVVLVVVAALALQRLGAACRRYLAGATAALAAGGVLDWITWGAPFASTWRNVDYNLIESGADAYGSEPAAFYLETLASGSGPVALLVLVGLVAAARRAGLGVAVVATFVLVHTLTGHKELRFVYPVVPLALVLAGVGLAALAQRYARGREAPAVAGAAAVAVALSLAWLPGLTFDRLGERRGFFPSEASVSGNLADFNRMLSIAGSRDTTCGVAVVGGRPDLQMVFLGGYSHLHRDVPLFGIEPGEAAGPGSQRLRAVNVVITPHGVDAPSGFSLRAEFGDARMFTRPGSCAPPPPGYTTHFPR